MPIIRDILVGSAKRGADLDLMCRELGFKTNDLYHADIKVPFEQAYKTWNVALKFTKDDLLGLHLGEQTNPSIMGMVGYLMQSSSNLMNAFESVCNNNSFVTDMFQYSIVRNQFIDLVYQPAPIWIKISPISAMHACDQAMAGTLRVFELLSNEKVRVLRASFVRAKPKSLREYERVFDCPMEFNSKSNRLSFEKKHLHIPVVSYDESLFKNFNQLIQQSSKQTKTFADKIKLEILNTFSGQPPKIQVMASRLNLNIRTLQRGLEQEGKSYRELCRDVGVELAKQLLKENSKNVRLVANLMGYSDSSSFHRAFKAWTGRKPSTFRKQG